MKIQWKKVQSSWITHVGKIGNHLLIKDKYHDINAFRDFAEDHYDNLINASSVGKYLHAYIIKSNCDNVSHDAFNEQYLVEWISENWGFDSTNSKNPKERLYKFKI